MKPITPKLLESYLKNELDPQTTEYVEHWLRENKIERDMLPKMLDPSEGVRIMASLDPKKDWTRVNRSLPAQRSAIFSPLLKVAASLVFAILLGYFWHQRDQLTSSPEEFLTIRNDERAVKLISLDDGSEVHLNQGASLTYPEAFREDRRIELSGEAFFDVAPDPQHPFLIQTADCEVQVKGTSFNVYSDSSGVEVAVSSGVVQFTSPDKETLTLEKDQMATYTRRAGTLTKSSNDHFNTFSWRTGVLIFQRAPLDEVARDLSRYFRRDIRIRSNPDAQFPEFTSRFEKPSLTEVLEEMKTVLQVTYRMDEDHVLIEVGE